MGNTPFSLSGSLWVLSSKIYMADLESALHYILRVEVGKFSVLEGQRLVALKKFVAVLAQVSWAPASLDWQLHAGSVCLPASQRRASLESAQPPPSGAHGLAGHLDPAAVLVHHGLVSAVAPPAPHHQGRPPHPTPPRAGGWMGRRARCPGDILSRFIACGSACRSPPPHSLPWSLGKQDPWTPL